MVIADEILTPKGLFATREIGAQMSYFIEKYKGINESFMSGCRQLQLYINLRGVSKKLKIINKQTKS